ncbi:MAG: hypothetical protein U1F43_05955 [Myxococcota bacterium]
MGALGAGALGCLGGGDAGLADARASDAVGEVADATAIEPDVSDAASVAPDVEDATSVGPDVADVASVAPDVADATSVAPDAVGDGCFDAPSAGHHVVTCGAISYDVEVPPACLTSACGLIVDIHGLTMTAALEDANTLMRERGRDAGFVVIQPNAPSFFGVPTWDMSAHAEPIFAFVAEVAERLGTDPDRAYAMGFSQGGGLTWQLVCAHADFFAAAAPLAALPGCAFDAAHHPSREVDMLLVHGRKDTVVAFSQLESQRDAALAYWPVGTPTVVEDDGAHRATRWTTAGGTTFEVWEHDYTATSFLLNGHCVPGSPQVNALPLAFGCQQGGTFEYGALALAFFQAHRR